MLWSLRRQLTRALAVSTAVMQGVLSSTALRRTVPDKLYKKALHVC